MAHEEPDAESDGSRWQFGLIAVAIGVVAILAAFALVMWNWRDDRGLVALGVIASPIAAMVGAYFGVQVSASAAKDAQNRAAASEKGAQARATVAEADKTSALTDVATLMGRLSPTEAETIRPQLRTLQ